MATFFTFLVILGLGSFAVVALVGWLAQTFPRGRAFLAFLLTCAATYSFAFCFDMVLLAFTGGLPLANAVLPIFVWFGIAAFLQILAFSTSPVRWPLFVPHLINALLAASVGFVHPRNFVVSALVLFIGIIVFVAKPRHDAVHEATPNA